MGNRYTRLAATDAGPTIHADIECAVPLDTKTGEESKTPPAANGLSLNGDGSLAPSVRRLRGETSILAYLGPAVEFCSNHRCILLLAVASFVVVLVWLIAAGG